ncbi:hypothetical protein [Altererythrobacter aquiaggeris]|uniref:hypothetical protein n=1 Tax=Aestuarierythrobacter aquiaggeris TaxID=1898396 RepID=UPI003018FA91
MVNGPGPTDLRPRLILRFGITGHRPPRLDTAHYEAIRTECSRIFAAAKEQVHEIHSQNTAVFSAEEPLIELVTPLAAGADTIGSEAAVANGIPLAVVLPMNEDEYKTGFTKGEWTAAQCLLQGAQSNLRLDAPGISQDEAFEIVGQLVIAQSDILIAIWDGDEARGRGGTPAVIAEAVAEHMPVIHIRPSGAQPPQLIWSGVEDVVPDRPSLGGTGRTDAMNALSSLIEALVSPPQAGLEAKGLAAFLNEHRSVRSRGFSWPLLLVAAGVKRLANTRFRGPTTEECSANMEPLLAATKGRGKFGAFMSGPFLRRFAIADADADRFALRFRSSFIRNFVLAALAVFLALFGLLWPAGKTFLIAAELAVIFTIIVNTHQANQRGWHQAWLDHRHLAERLRLLVLPAMLGKLSLRDAEDGTRMPGWISWYSRASAREMGLAEGTCDRKYMERVREAAIELLDEQIQYHRRTHRAMKAADHRLHLIGDGLFALTIIACLVWLGLKAVSGNPGSIAGVGITEMVTFATALLPALAASLYGIRMQGDFAVTADRSDAFDRRLGQLKIAIEREPLGYTRLSQRLHRLGEIMLSDVQQWKSSYQTRPLSLPG